jgi:hypothetical protein
MPIPTEKSTVKNEPPEFELPDEGIYQAEIVDVELQEGVKTNYGVKDKVNFRLGILDEKYRGERLMYFATKSFTQGFKGGQASNLWKLASCVYREDLDDKQEFDINTLVGGVVSVLVKHQPNKDGSRTYANVVNLLKIKEGEELSKLTEEERNNIMPKEQDEAPVNEDNVSEDIKASDVPF